MKWKKEKGKGKRGEGKIEGKKEREKKKTTTNYEAQGTKRTSLKLILTVGSKHTSHSQILFRSYCAPLLIMTGWGLGTSYQEVTWFESLLEWLRKDQTEITHLDTREYILNTVIRIRMAALFGPTWFFITAEFPRMVLITSAYIFILSTGETNPSGLHINVRQKAFQGCLRAPLIHISFKEHQQVEHNLVVRVSQTNFPSTHIELFWSTDMHSDDSIYFQDGLKFPVVWKNERNILQQMPGEQSKSTDCPQFLSARSSAREGLHIAKGDAVCMSPICKSGICVGASSGICQPQCRLLIYDSSHPNMHT